MDFLKRKKERACDLWLTSRMIFRPTFFGMDCNLLLGHEVSLVCPDQLFFFFLNGREENRPEHRRIEKKIQESIGYIKVTKDKSQLLFCETFVSVT